MCVEKIPPAGRMNAKEKQIPQYEFMMGFLKEKKSALYLPSLFIVFTFSERTDCGRNIIAWLLAESRALPNSNSESRYLRKTKNYERLAPM
jgi:hypothetical protein